MFGLASLQPRILGKLECAAASAAQTKLRAKKGAQLRLKTYVRRNSVSDEMSNDRVLCKSPDCRRTILPQTAKKTNGYCMVCVRERKNRERQEYIRKNQRLVNPYDGLGDPLEILEIMHSPRRSYDPLVVFASYEKTADEVISDLDGQQLQNLTLRTRDLWLSNIELAENLTRSLAAFTSHPLDPILIQMIELGIFYPPFVYARSSDTVRDLLLSLDPPEDPSTLDKYLQSMAWARGPRIENKFREWLEFPPHWSKTLYIPAASYSISASWEFGNDDRPRELSWSESRLLQPSAEHNPTVKCGDPLTQSCPWCKRPLTALLELQGPALELLHFEAPWKTLQIVTCIACSCYGHVFTNVDLDGSFSWHDQTPPKFFDADSEWLPFPSLSLKEGPIRNSLFASEQFLPPPFSKIGGHPCWIQHPDYPVCPSCQRRMPFLAQLDMQDLEEYGEGTYYMFLCAACKTAATAYQQT